MGHFIIIAFKYDFYSKDIIMNVYIIETKEGDFMIFGTYDQAKKFVDEEIAHTRLLLGQDDGTKYKIVDLDKVGE